MIKGEAFVSGAAELGINFCTSVPCSLLTPLVNSILGGDQIRHVGATSEGEAIALASGAFLAGAKPLVLMQNSGLGNAVNPLLTLNAVFKLPVLLVISWRGHPNGHDEPQHQLIGQILPDLLSLLGITYDDFPDSQEEIRPKLRCAVSHMEATGLPYAFIVREGAIAHESLGADLTQRELRPPGEYYETGEEEESIARWHAIKALRASADASVPLIATTGKTGRELFAGGDDKRNFYMLGSMGCASAIALGLALVLKTSCLVLDGDGALLMKLGNLSTVGVWQPDGFVHVVLDNGVHDSTGGQPTNASAVSFPRLALAAGYRRAASCGRQSEIANLAEHWLRAKGPSLICIRTRPGSIEPLPRPDIAPDALARRFASFLASESRTVRTIPEIG